MLTIIFKIKALLGCFDYISFHLDALSNEYSNISLIWEINITLKLVSSGDVKPQCEIIHNRDKNAVQNMLFIVETIKKTGKRPLAFSRLLQEVT